MKVGKTWGHDLNTEVEMQQQNRIGGDSGNWSHSGDHFMTYTNIKSIHHAPKANIMLYVNYNSVIFFFYFLKLKKNLIVSMGFRSILIQPVSVRRHF